MFESITYEGILQRMLDRVPDTVDKREGSVIYDALAPAAIELQNMYINLDGVLNESFADTASLPYLIRRAAERGITQYPATYAVIKAVATPSNIEISTGSRFSLNASNYIVMEKIADGEYKMICETAGVIGNNYSGDLIPIDYIEGLQTIEITEVLIPGEDEEDVESLRERYFNSFDSQAFGGNIADYKEKINAINGVGGVKIYRATSVGGAIRAVIIDSTYSKPSSDLVDEVQETIDPINNQGEGVGLAPIGHIVTIEGCGAISVDVQTSLEFKDGWTWEAVKTYVESAIDDYLKELSSEWEENGKDGLIVRINQLESRLLNIEGVRDISGTLLNGNATNLSIDKDSIPVRGTVTNV